MRNDVSSWKGKKFSAHLQTLETEGFCAAVGAGSDSFPDAWIVVHKVSDDERHVLYIQSKRRRDLGTKSTQEKVLKKDLSRLTWKVQVFTNSTYLDLHYR
jgi:hypothetical protein